MSAHGLTPGQQVYKYQLVKKIGTGQSEVWLAKDIATNTEVALKVLDASNGDVVSCLYEARVGAVLSHPNLCEVKYADLTEVSTPSGNVPLVVIAFAYLPHGACTRLIRGPGMMPAETVRHLLLDVLAGLEYLHENGGHHNDIKPANILTNAQDRFLLTDYGIAWSPSSGVSTAAFYKPHIAPETAANGGAHVPSVQSDLYQLGVTAYRLLNGGDVLTDLWTKMGDAAFRAEVVAGKLPDRDGYHPSVPASLRRIINKAIAVNPSNRYASAIEMRRDLEKLHFPWQWTFDANGELCCLKKGVEYRIETEPGKGGTDVFCRATYPGGNSRRISRFTSKGLKQTQVEQSKKRIMQAILVEP